MNELLLLAAHWVELVTGPAILTFLRVGAAVALFPAFGDQTIPVRFRLVVALAFTAIILPAVADRHPAEGTALLALGEVLAGLLTGLALRIMVFALQLAGSIAAQATSLSQLFPAGAAEPLPALGTLLTMTALALAVQAGLHVQLAQFLIKSYDVLPAGKLISGAVVAEWGTDRIAGVTALGFSLAAPFVLAALLWNVALGLVNRAMPHLMVAFVGAPALSLGSLALAALAAPLMLEIWLDGFKETLGALRVVN